MGFVLLTDREKTGTNVSTSPRCGSHSESGKSGFASKINHILRFVFSSVTGYKYQRNFLSKAGY